MRPPLTIQRTPPSGLGIRPRPDRGPGGPLFPAEWRTLYGGREARLRIPNASSGTGRVGSVPFRSGRGSGRHPSGLGGYGWVGHDRPLSGQGGDRLGPLPEWAAYFRFWARPGRVLFLVGGARRASRARAPCSELLAGGHATDPRAPWQCPSAPGGAQPGVGAAAAQAALASACGLRHGRQSVQQPHSKEGPLDRGQRGRRLLVVPGIGDVGREGLWTRVSEDGARC